VAQHEVERFAQNGGRFTSVVGFVVAGALVVAWVVRPSDVPLWVPAAALLLAALIWTAIVRPRVLVTERDDEQTLVLRTMLETVHIPLAGVEEVAVRQVMAVRVGERRFVCSGTGRTLRQALKDSNTERMRRSMSGLGGLDPVAQVDPGIIYGDYVEMRVMELANAERERRDLRRHSAEVRALADDVRREPAWREVGLLVAAVALVVLAAALS
jgi:hypothetical protein